jgi:hypothetical protein
MTDDSMSGIAADSPVGHSEIRAFFMNARMEDRSAGYVKNHLSAPCASLIKRFHKRKNADRKTALPVRERCSFNALIV